MENLNAIEASLNQARQCVEQGDAVTGVALLTGLITSLDKELESAPDSKVTSLLAQACLLRGRLLLQMGMAAPAQQDAERAVKLDPSLASVNGKFEAEGKD